MWVGLQLAIMDIMATHLTPARPTDITVLTGLQVDYSSAPVRGTAGAAVGVDGGVVGVTAAATATDAAATDAADTDAAATDTDAGPMAHADMVAAQSADTVAVADTAPVADIMAVVAVSTAAAEAASTVAAAGTAAEADTANRRVRAFRQ
jgi:hypothetical protein